ncbi:hypothetical protein MRB53_037816 [Persea americana]|nr:hypothetical protein MRB53_037816 [Persea americana]
MEAYRPLSEMARPFRRTSTSASSTFASSSTSPSSKRFSTPSFALPFRSTSSARNGPEPQPRDASGGAQDEYRALVSRSFCPHVALLPSADTEELLAQKGFSGGLLEIMRPFGERIQGKITIRDNTGSSRSYDDFSVRFVKLNDGLENPRVLERRSTDSRRQGINGYLDQIFPYSSTRLRTGGDVAYVEDAVEKHLEFHDAQSEDLTRGHKRAKSTDTMPSFESPFQELYFSRLLSGLPLSPHETFSHPVACVVTVSSRSSDPIEEFRSLTASIMSGENVLPPWISNEFLRYYVLVHDEDHDDLQRTMATFEQMKRHFGLNSHLLRLRSSQCVASDDDTLSLPECEWISAAEELSEIQKRGA